MLQNAMIEMRMVAKTMICKWRRSSVIMTMRRMIMVVMLNSWMMMMTMMTGRKIKLGKV